MRRHAGTSGPYSVGRPQREEYIDGGSPLAGLWRARPYSDVEPPHPGADPDMNADDDGVGAPPTRLSPPARWQRSAKGEGEPGKGKGEPELEYDDDLSFGTPLWAKVAPLADAVTDLMKSSDSKEKLGAILESNGVANAKLIWYVVDRAVRLGFGFRYVNKEWRNFLKLVPACTALKVEYTRDLLKKALLKAGIGKMHPFADGPDEMEFERLGRKSPGTDSGDPQEVYEERTPGRIPGLETKNIEGWLDLLHGKTSVLEEKAWKEIKNKRIVDPESGRFSTARLQSMLRYAFDMPDSHLAMALIAAVVLREAGRLADEKSGGRLLELLKGGGRAVTAGEVLSGMSPESSAILERWLSVAVSSLAFVGALEPGGHDEAKGAMRRSLAGMAAGMLHSYLRLLLGRAAPPPAVDGPGPGGGIRPPADEVGRLAREAMAAMEERTGENADRAAVRALRGALRGMRGAADSAAFAAAADAVVAALRAAGVEDADGLADVRRAAQGTRPQRSASTAVADVVKRIVSPARHRVVTREEAEGGIEVGAEGEDASLRLPARYHAVSRALSGGL